VKVATMTMKASQPVANLNSLKKPTDSGLGGFCFFGLLDYDCSAAGLCLGVSWDF